MIFLNPAMATNVVMPLVSLLDNYARNFDRSSEAGCRTAIDFILNECLTVMVSWLDILLEILLNHEDLRKATLHQLSRPKTADRRHPSVGMLSRYIAKCHSPTKLYLHGRGISTQRPLSMVVSIMESVLSSSPVPRILPTIAFIHSCSSLRPNSNAALTVLYPNSLFIWHVSINLDYDDYEVTPLSTALLQMVTFSYS
jgi:hypothetical protein